VKTDSRGWLYHARSDDVGRADVVTERTNQELHESAAPCLHINGYSAVAFQGLVIFTEIAVFR
jgi:hypothetical protein